MVRKRGRFRALVAFATAPGVVRLMRNRVDIMRKLRVTMIGGATEPTGARWLGRLRPAPDKASVSVGAV
jgi:hypothetical protein